MRILVVDDEMNLVNAVKEGLEGESYSATVAHTGQEGLIWSKQKASTWWS